MKSCSEGAANLKGYILYHVHGPLACCPYSEIMHRLSTIETGIIILEQHLQKKWMALLDLPLYSHLKKGYINLYVLVRQLENVKQCRMLPL